MRAQLSILALFGVWSTLVRAEIEFRCSPVVIAQHVGAFRIGTTPAGAMVQPYFSYLLHAQSDFGHPGPLCVHVLFPSWRSSNRTFSKTRVVARIAARAFARSQDVLTN
jgi:hypothetical protein